MGLSTEDSSSFLTPLCDVSFSVPGFETQSDRGMSSPSESPLAKAGGALKGLVLPGSAWVSSSEEMEPFAGLPSTGVLSSAPAEGGLRARGGLTLEVECSTSSVFTDVASLAVDSLKVDAELRALIGDLVPVVKASGRSCA